MANYMGSTLHRQPLRMSRSISTTSPSPFSILAVNFSSRFETVWTTRKDTSLRDEEGNEDEPALAMDRVHDS